VTMREGYISNITERKKSEDALRLSKVNLEVAAQELQQQNTQLNEFAHILSHNLRSPVGNIQALIPCSTRTARSTSTAWSSTTSRKPPSTCTKRLMSCSTILRVKKENAMERTTISLDDMLTRVKQDLVGEIINTNANITSIFLRARPCTTISPISKVLSSTC